jgi:hypothetical protein
MSRKLTDSMFTPKGKRSSCAVLMRLYLGNSAVADRSAGIVLKINKERLQGLRAAK